MARQYYQSQYILNQCFQNRQNILRATFNNAQDYLNAVYDSAQDAIRVNIAGGMLPMVDRVEDLPDSASDGQICPVYNSELGGIDFYQWDDAAGEWVYRGGTSSGSPISDDEKEAISWMTDHLDQIKEVANFNYIVNVTDIELPSDGSRTVVVQGQPQDIDDDLDGDDDRTTPYRIDISGYVLSVATYADASAPVPDRYFTRITYESAGGGLGFSHVYLQQEEYDYFASLPGGKNIIRAYYLTNAMTSPVKRLRYWLHDDRTVTDEDGRSLPVIDEEDGDGDAESTVRIDVGGYVLGVETYASDGALVPDKCYVKTVYESDGVHSGRTRIFMTGEEYDFFASLGNGKNTMDIYYVSTVFPASVTITETQLMFPGMSGAYYVAMDASGNPHNVSDDPDRDGDPATHVRITVNGYAIDVDGYYTEQDTIKKRLIVKMSYTPGVDSTDIYVDREYYEHVSSLGNGKNVISIYTVGAGIGVDASRLSGPRGGGVWKGRKSSLEELSQVTGQQNGDTWQVGDLEYSWNGQEWVLLGGDGQGASKETPVSQVEGSSLEATAGGCYLWTVPDGADGATISLNATSGTHSVTVVDVDCRGDSVLYGTNVIVEDQPDPNSVTRYEIEFDGTTARMRRTDGGRGIEDEIELPSGRATHVLSPGKSYLLSLGANTTILIDDMVKSVDGSTVDLLDGKCADIRLHLSTNEHSVEWKTVSEKDEEEQTKIHLATSLERGFSYLMVLRLSGGRWNVCALEL